ncbi:MAG: T9SS type A sorting domain-containing protein [candidate division Zixibacteria bacterium]|nr:T9SS type A sorting domain-containing protein [candidate division Zixibacteria bacterium]
MNDNFGTSYRQWTGDIGQMMVNAVVYAASNTVLSWRLIPGEELYAYSPEFRDMQIYPRVENNSAAASELFRRGSMTPSGYELLEAYPNPFNAKTNISFNVHSAGDVNLEVYNLLGQNVATLIDGHIEAGMNSIAWDASDYSSGIYFYKLTTENKTLTKRMTLLK